LIVGTFLPLGLTRFYFFLAAIVGQYKAGIAYRRRGRKLYLRQPIELPILYGKLVVLLPNENAFAIFINARIFYPLLIVPILVIILVQTWRARDTIVSLR
jgi:hypothetical protein